jgi:hypothetical protein
MLFFLVLVKDSYSIIRYTWTKGNENFYDIKKIRRTSKFYLLHTISLKCVNYINFYLFYQKILGESNWMFSLRRNVIDINDIFINTIRFKN